MSSSLDKSGERSRVSVLMMMYRTTDSLLPEINIRFYGVFWTFETNTVLSFCFSTYNRLAFSYQLSNKSHFRNWMSLWNSTTSTLFFSRWVNNFSRYILLGHREMLRKLNEPMKTAALVKCYWPVRLCTIYRTFKTKSHQPYVYAPTVCSR